MQQSHTIFQMYDAKCIHSNASYWLSSLLGDRSFMEEKTYWLHEKNDEFMR